MIRDGIEAVRARVVEGEAERDQRAIGRVLRQAAEGVGVGEEARPVGQAADRRVLDDGVAVVEVKSVVEEVCVGCNDERDCARRCSPGERAVGVYGVATCSFIARVPAVTVETFAGVPKIVIVYVCEPAVPGVSTHVTGIR